MPFTAQDSGAAAGAADARVQRARVASPVVHGDSSRCANDGGVPRAVGSGATEPCGTGTGTPSPVGTPSPGGPDAVTWPCHRKAMRERVAALQRYVTSFR